MAPLLYLQPAAHQDAARTSAARWPEQHELAGFCERWAPFWKTTAGGIYLDLIGTGRLHGAGLDGAVLVCRDALSRWGSVSGGLGRDPLVARLAGRLASVVPNSLLHVPPGGEQAFLAPFSITVLARRFPAEIARLLQFGVRTLGDLQNVPRALLSASFGRDAVILLDAARGSLSCDLRHERPQRAKDCFVIGAAWRRPLASSACESTLRRALARRVMLICAGGPAHWSPWSLHVTWDGGKSATATIQGRGLDAWPAWLLLIEDLWGRLPARRSGLVALELSAAPSGRVTSIQAELFPDAVRGSRIDLVEAWRRLPGVPLHFGSEALLDAWGIRWQTAAWARSRATAGAAAQIASARGPVDASIGDS